MSNVNSYVDQDYYILYGLGTAIKGIGSGVTSNYIETVSVELSSTTSVCPLSIYCLRAVTM